MLISFYLSLEFEMVQMEEGNIKNKENDTENVNLTAADATCNESVDVIISAEEVQPEVVSPEIHLGQDQISEINMDISSTLPESETICQKIIADIIDDIATQEVNLEAFCQNILLDILEKIEMRQPSPDHDVVPDNQIINDNQTPDNDILQINVGEINVEQIPLLPENIVQKGE